MPRKKDITGQRFGRLVAVECLKERTKYGGCLWRCRCDCGGEKIVPLHYLRQGSTKSCGCLTHIKDISGQRAEEKLHDEFLKEQGEIDD